MTDFIQTGANLIVQINNKSIGTVTSFSYNIDYGKKAIRGCDNPFPQEIAPGAQTVRGQVGLVRLKGSSLESQGLVARQSSPDVDSSQMSITDLLSEPYISISLMDRHLGKLVFRCDRATVLGQDWRINARGIFEGSFSFEGLLSGAVE